MKSVLLSHLEPKSLMIAERFKFHKCSQREVETVAEYVVALKQFSTYCEFGDFLNDALQDHLVCGLYKESLQEVTFRAGANLQESM